MHELSVDSEVTFCKVMGSAEILPTRPSVDPNEVIRLMDKTWSGSSSTPSDWSGLQLTTVSSSVIISTSHHTEIPEPLHLFITASMDNMAEENRTEFDYYVAVNLMPK